MDRVFPGGGFGFAVISASGVADHSSFGQQERQHPMLLYALIDTKGCQEEEKRNTLMRSWRMTANGIIVLVAIIIATLATYNTLFAIAIASPNLPYSMFFIILWMSEPSLRRCSLSSR
jgi:hypothetical protein